MPYMKSVPSTFFREIVAIVQPELTWGNQRLSA